MEKGKDKEKEGIKTENSQDISGDLSKNQAILYTIIIAGALTIFVLSMIGINLFMLLIIIGAVLVYVYLDKDILNEDSIDSIKHDKEIKAE